MNQETKPRLTVSACPFGVTLTWRWAGVTRGTVAVHLTLTIVWTLDTITGVIWSNRTVGWEKFIKRSNQCGTKRYFPTILFSLFDILGLPVESPLFQCSSSQHSLLLCGLWTLIQFWYQNNKRCFPWFRLQWGGHQNDRSRKSFVTVFRNFAINSSYMGLNVRVEI